MNSERENFASSRDEDRFQGDTEIESARRRTSLTSPILSCEGPRDGLASCCNTGACSYDPRSGSEFD
jgi:hypothetical protein